MQQVPLFIDTEDKIAGPFTWKQLSWLGGGMLIGVALWRSPLDQAAFITLYFPVVLIVLAFTFYRPQGLPLIQFVQYALIYFFKPRRFLWQREYKEPDSSSSQKDQVIPTTSRREEPVTTSDILSLSAALDSHGEESNERLTELIKRNTAKTETKRKGGIFRRKK